MYVISTIMAAEKTELSNSLILSFNGCEDLFCGRMGSNTMYSSSWVTMVWRNIPHHLHLHIHLEDGSSKFHTGVTRHTAA
jgi:hypothetical protein